MSNVFADVEACETYFYIKKIVEIKKEKLNTNTNREFLGPAVIQKKCCTFLFSISVL